VANCCDPTLNCSSSAECVAIVKCLGQCATVDQACLDSCEQQHPNGAASANAFIRCIGQRCVTPCR
jgi:hypothetical protein